MATLKKGNLSKSSLPKPEKQRIMAKKGLEIKTMPKSEKKLDSYAIEKLRKMVVEKRAERVSKINSQEILKGLRLTASEKYEAPALVSRYIAELKKYITTGHMTPELNKFSQIPRVAKSKAILQVLYMDPRSTKLFFKVAPKLGITVKDVVRAKILITFAGPTMDIPIKRLHDAGLSYGEMYTYGLEVLKEPEMRRQVDLAKRDYNYPRDVPKKYLGDITSIMDAERTIKQIKELDINKIKSQIARDIREGIETSVKSYAKDKTVALNDRTLRELIFKPKGRFISSDIALIEFCKEANIPVDFLLRTGELKLNDIFSVYPSNVARKGYNDFKQWYRARKPILSENQIEVYEKYFK